MGSIWVEQAPRIDDTLAVEEQQINRLLDGITGMGRYTAEVLVAEIGVDLQRFPSTAHLCSWTGVAPGNHERAGKCKGGKTRKGSPWLRAALVEVAHAVGRTKTTYLEAQYRRLVGRRGKKHAAVAVAHNILTIIYHGLTTSEPFSDLGGDYFDRRDQHAVQRRLVHRLEVLGYTVSLQTKEPAT